MGAERIYLADTYCSSLRGVRTGTEKGRNLETRDDAEFGHGGLLLVSCLACFLLSLLIVFFFFFFCRSLNNTILKRTFKFRVKAVSPLSFPFLWKCFFFNSHHSLYYVANMVIDNQCNPYDNSLTETVPLSPFEDMRKGGHKVGQLVKKQKASKN